MVCALTRLLVGLLKLAFLLCAVSALLVAGLGYGLYRLFGGHRRLTRARARAFTRQAQRAADDAGVWLRVKIPGLNGRRCPHCDAPLDPEDPRALCPHCYGDLQRTCPGCGEAVWIGRKVCPHCAAELERRA